MESEDAPLSETEYNRSLLNRLIAFIASLMVLAFVALGAFMWAFWRYPVSGEPSHWGTFGDYIGGVVGTLVGVATWALLLYTVRLQKQVLDVAEDQLTTSKIELRLTREEMKRSTIALQQQSFESTFFRMMEQVRAAATAETIREPGDTVTPIANYVANRCNNAIAMQRNLTTGQVNEEGWLRVRQALTDYPNWSEPFIRLMYHTLKLIHYSGLPEDKRVMYANIFRAQFTGSELAVIYFNLATKIDSGLAHYVNYYGFLKHLPHGDNAEALAKWPPLGSIEWSAFKGYARRKDLNIKPDTSIALPE